MTASMKGLRVFALRFLSPSPDEPTEADLNRHGLLDVGAHGWDMLLSRLPPEAEAEVRLSVVRPVVYIAVGRELNPHRMAVEVAGLGLYDVGWSWYSSLVVAAAGGFGQRIPLLLWDAALAGHYARRAQ
jgi:hypothetical protein